MRAAVPGLLALLAVTGCGTGAEVRGPNGGGKGDGGRTDAPTFTLDGGGTRDTPPSEVSNPIGMACAMSTVKAERLPLDVYLMLDASYSMLDPTLSGASKWDAVKTALRGFMMDPQSAGMGLGMQVFPQVRSEIPEDCFQDSTCAAFGPCLIVKTCSPGTTVRLCETNAGCAVGQTCLPLGGCTQSDAFCAPVGNTCGAGVGGTPLGNRCEQIPGYCIARDLCDASAYAAPSVPIAPLPGGATMLSALLDRRRPEGRTTLGPALAGAIAHARDRMTKDPSRKVAVVLASDGLPVVCSPMDVRGVAAVAEAGATGSPAVATFTVGVVTVGEAPEALANLGLISRAGGTTRPYVITTGQNVEQMFLGALDSIRTTALTCEFKVPPGTGGTGVDFNQVNVLYTPGDGSPATTVVNVPAAQACDDTRGGWYYDVDPSGGGKPASILACPVTCDRLKMDQMGKVDIVLGCRTIVD
jgi:hypothetical protein